MAPQAVLDRMQSMAPMRPTETLAQQALGGGAGGAYLAPALYRPVVQAGPLPLPSQRQTISDLLFRPTETVPYLLQGSMEHSRSMTALAPPYSVAQCHGSEGAAPT